MTVATSRVVPVRTLRLFAVLLTAAVALLALPGSAAAAPAEQSSFLRLAHISPNTPNVDIYLTSVGDPSVWFTVPGVGYGSVTDYRALPVDSYTISMRAAGAPADSPPVISTVLTTKPGAAYTVAGTGLYDQLGLTVLDDELGMPPAGNARLRVVNGAATAPAVDLSVVGGPVIADGVAFADTTGYRTVPVGNWTVQATTAGGAAPTSLPIDIAGNAVYTVLLLDRNGGLEAQLLLDSAGAAAVPTGGVDTGFGGTAAEPAARTLLPAGALVALALVGPALVGFALVGPRRRSASRT
jgi:Domain of unknown function (DUF4397)